jgi:AI-2E family transporter
MRGPAANVLSVVRPPLPACVEVIGDPSSDRDRLNGLLVTGGVVSAAIVGIVALAVQQLDNDVLAPWVYGRSLALHPVVILVSVVGGGALFGIAGTLLAVPFVAVAVSFVKELE